MNDNAEPTVAERAFKGPSRRHKRFRTQSLLIDNPVAGRVLNVGQGGLAVETLKGLSVGESYHFKVRLGEKHLRLSGRIQWCRLTAAEAAEDSTAPPVYRAGIALEEDLTSRAWETALKRLTEEPAELVWHRARSKPSSSPGAELEAEQN
jgi:hypothetical protein